MGASSSRKTALKQWRLREFLCVVLGHAWKPNDWPPHQAGFWVDCQRCYRRGMNL